MWSDKTHWTTRHGEIVVLSLVTFSLVSQRITLPTILFYFTLLPLRRLLSGGHLQQQQKKNKVLKTHDLFQELIQLFQLLTSGIQSHHSNLLADVCADGGKHSTRDGTFEFPAESCPWTAACCTFR